MNNKFKKIFFVAGILAVGCIMASNLQYSYSGYGILTANQHNEVLAQGNNCWYEYQAWQNFETNFDIECGLLLFWSYDSPHDLCASYSGTCKQGCYLLMWNYYNFQQCLYGNNYGGGGGSTGSTGSTSAIDNHYKIEYLLCLKPNGNWGQKEYCMPNQGSSYCYSDNPCK